MIPRPAKLFVADAARLRIFDIEHGKLTGEVVYMAPQARLRERDMTSDRPGHERGRHPMEPSMTMKEHEARVFAKETAEHLDRAVDPDPAAKLVLIAAPRFLGLVRAEIDGRTEERLDWVVDKDLTRLTVRELEQRLPGYLRNGR